MKIILVFFVFPFLLSSCQDKPVKRNEPVKRDGDISRAFIEIRHTGMENKNINPLIISTKKVSFKVGRNDLIYLEPNKPITEEMKQAYLHMHYDFVITDTMTYQSIIEFVNTHQGYFTNYTNINYGDYADYAIIVNGKKYDVFYKYKYQFFLRFKDYLKMKKCDKILIKKLDAY